MTGDEVRAEFLRFFKGKGHKVLPSSSLVPRGDPTLLLTSAGMVQIKPYFMGEAVPPSRRLASCQKCFRTTDIEAVGDAKHLTFFEMLGNFSVGDYFKEGAISWAWEFVTGWLKLPPERLWITVFLDDDEAFDCWRQIGIPESKIVRLGEKDNFWGPAGDSGPCGPCSEIHYDFGEDAGCGKATCGPDCDCSRFSEIWNLVFTQYDQDKEGNRTLLPRPNIDTGMGLERTAAIMQGKTSVYESDFFAPLIQIVSELASKEYGLDSDADNAMRIIAEHGRGITFLISDGVLPSSEGAGYVLRRLMRRCVLFGRRIGLDKPFLTEIARTTIDHMGHIYPELRRRQEFILKVIGAEESRFGRTLSEGLQIIEDEIIPIKTRYERQVKKVADGIEWEIKDLSPNMPVSIMAQTFYTRIRELRSWAVNSGASHRLVVLYTEGSYRRARDTLMKGLYQKSQRRDISRASLIRYVRSRLKKMRESLERISGKEAFEMYDTYGFPVEITKEIAAEHGFSVDLEGFEKEMEKQRERARAAHKFGGGSKESLGLDQLSIEETPFVGYRSTRHKSAVAGIVIDSESRERIEEGEEAGLVLEATAFYAEMGGQVGDTGQIRSAAGIFTVTNTIRTPADIIVHRGYLEQGSLVVGEEVEAEVDGERRLDIARNHTATHLLHAALRRVLGGHIEQKGSLVAPDRFRFDFSHLTAMTEEEVREVQHAVNESIRQNLIVHDEEIPYRQAIEAGAIALFDEKYGDMVRVIRIGQPAVSTELCGGTHVSYTGEIGFFYLLGESSVGAGLRRIEAATGRGAEELIEKQFSNLAKAAEYLETEPAEVLDKTRSLIDELDVERKRALSLEKELAKKEVESLVGQAEQVNGVTLLVSRVPPSRQEVLREMADLIRDKLKSAVVVLGTVYQDRPSFIAAVTPDLVERGYDAGKIVKKVAAVTGGGGGGKAGLAQAGGKDKAKLDEALQLVKRLV